MKSLLTGIIAGALLLQIGCTPISSAIKGKTPEAPSGYKKALSEESVPNVGKWWKAFNEPELDRLMEELTKNNLDIRKSYYGYLQYEELIKKAKAEGGLNISATANAGRKYNYSRPQDTRYYTEYNFSAAASYEIDLFNRIKNNKQAALHNAFSSKSDLEALYITLSASLADAYFLLAERREYLRLTKEIVKVSEERLNAILNMYENGLKDLSDVLDVYNSHNSILSSVPSLEKDVELAENSLSILLGKYAGELGSIKTDGLADTPPPLPLETPVKIMEQRPDLKSAYHSLMAKDYEIAVAAADRFPSLTLKSAMTNTAEQSYKLFDPVFQITSILAELTVSILDWGAKKAEVERRKLAVKAEMFTYKKAVLTAFKEIDDAVAKNNGLSRQLTVNNQIVNTNSELLELAKDRYSSGQVTYYELLTAIQEYKNSILNRLSVKRQLFSARVELARVLGGNWQKEYVEKLAEAKDEK